MPDEKEIIDSLREDAEFQREMAEEGMASAPPLDEYLSLEPCTICGSGYHDARWCGLRTADQ